ncbi:MATE efflux family protein [Castellaniella defragrans 65Phen]|uniref:Multidrug-efflux transporter n=1 Tax=Castellaniella defragrans (strain DSM 12143 / CCUG 39792 / 65Phen) TaxID=1437824 RepID=W8X8T4_CASD6|nr:MATE family efflux transporter [Castellaniella defragrans]CDM23630.1 MATE efflux family protein [Castellaniella defragrans 65Phen]
MTDASLAGRPAAPWRTILRQAWPILVSSWAGIVFAVLDTAMVGHASAADLQAMSLGASVYITVFVGLMGVVHALIPIIAQHFGAGRLREAGRAWGQGVWLALLLSALGGASMLFPDVWLSLSGDVEPEVRRRVAGYLIALALALPPALLFRTIYATSTAISQTREVMAINLGSIVFKLLFNVWFIFGGLGLPALGVVGAGIATLAVNWMMLAAGLWMIRHRRAFRALAPRLERPRWADQKELLRLGLPMGGSYLIEVCAFSFMALLIARDGLYVSGAQQILANLIALAYMLPMSLSLATASLTAQAVGALDPALARRTGLSGIGLVALGALLTGVVLIVGQDAIVRAYTDEVRVAAIALTLLQIAPWFHFWDAMHCISAYILRAYKIALVPLILQVTALTGLGLVGGWWLGYGPAAGALAPLASRLMPGAPVGAATMWIMAMLGLLLSALLLFTWYGHVLRRQARGA